MLADSSILGELLNDEKHKGRARIDPMWENISAIS